jgi:type I restriction enzyme R subunit
VNQALAKLTAGKSFTPTQRKWLDRIRRHPVVNLTIEKDDFDSLPVFADFGGWGKVNKDFGDALAPLIEEINTYIAA